MSWGSLDDCLLFAMVVKAVRGLDLASRPSAHGFSVLLVCSDESPGS